MSAKLDLENLRVLIDNVDADLDDIAAVRSTPGPAIAAIVMARGHLARVAGMLILASDAMAEAAVAGSLQ